VLEVGPGVFIPRPETELLVDEVLAFLGRRAAEGTRPARIIECGTGSGAIALSLAREAPGAWVVATELSPRAMAFARRNRDRAGLAERVALVESDLAACLA